MFMFAIEYIQDDNVAVVVVFHVKWETMEWKSNTCATKEYQFYQIVFHLNDKHETCFDLMFLLNVKHITMEVLANWHLNIELLFLFNFP